jgi:hypothetical protein
MDHTTTGKKSFVQIWGPKISHTTRSVVWTLGGGTARLLIISFSLLIVLWLLYANAWLPIQEEAGLPAGVVEQNPAINDTLLREINEKREQKIMRTPQSFSGYTRLFEARLTPPES